MKKMIVINWMFLVVFMSGCAANKPMVENTSSGLVYELLDVMQLEKMANQMETQMSNQMRNMVSQQLGNQEMSPEIQAITDKHMKRVSEILFEAVRWEVMKDKYAEIYSNAFTSEEMLALIEFYQSDIGQKTLEKMPQMITESMVVANEEVAKVLPEIKLVTQEMHQELQAERGK